MDQNPASAKAAMRALESIVLRTMFHDPKFVDRVVYLVEEQHFSKLHHRFLYKIILDFHKSFQRVPTSDEFNVELTRALQTVPEEDRSPIIDSLEKILTNSSPGNPDYIITRLEEFVHQADIRIALVKAGLAFEEGDLETALECMKRPFIKSGTGNHLPKELISTFSARIEERKDFETLRRIPTGIPSLDMVLNGGPGAGEIGTIIAPTSVGKSQALINLAANAIKQQKVSLYITLELSGLKVASRMDSLLTGIPVNFLTEEEQKLRGHEEGLKKYKDLFYCDQFPTGSLSVDRLIGFVKNFKRTRGQLDVLFLDYADLLSIGKHHDLRIALGNIYKSLRGLAQEEEIVVWTCSQSNRAGFTADHVSEVHSAESIDKMFVADIVISLNQKPEEYPNRMRLFVVKARDASKWLEIPLRCDFTRSRLWQDTEVPKSEGEITEAQENHVKEMLRRGGTPTSSGPKEQKTEEPREGN